MQPTGEREPASIGGYYPDAHDAQAPADVAVVIPTVLRPCIADAIGSVYRQSYSGRIQILIGVDKARGSPEHLEAVLASRPPHVSAIVLSLPFSTSLQHGGLHPAKDGGSLRSMLSFMANSRYVAYLDDDNTWEPDHLESLLEAVRGKAWAHSLRLLIDERTGAELAVDRWDSVGVNRGRFAKDGGLVDPSCLLVDKVRVSRALGRWSEGPGWESDRAFFAAIKDAAHGRVDRATTRYGVRATNILLELMRQGIEF